MVLQILDAFGWAYGEPIGVLQVCTLHLHDLRKKLDCLVLRGRWRE